MEQFIWRTAKMAVRRKCLPEGFAQLIELIYDAALDGAKWSAALEAIRAYIWADSALLRVYGARFADMKPQDKRHVAGALLLRRDDLEVVVGAQRSNDSPAFGSRELARVRKVVPHLMRALTLAERMEQTSLRATLADTMLGTTVPGILLFDAHGRVTYMNAAVEALLAGQKALTLRDDRLHTPNRQLQQWLDLMTVSKNRDAHGGTWEGSSARFTAFDGSGDLALTVLPWRNASMIHVSPAPGAVTVGVITPLDARETYSVQLIQSLFGLTAGEARLTEALVTTGSLASAAKKLAIRPSTARDRLKSVFRKTGFTTQMALITAVLRSPTHKAIPRSSDGPSPTGQA